MTSVSTSEWPGKKFERTIIEEFSKRNDAIKRVLQEKDGIRYGRERERKRERE